MATKKLILCRWLEEPGRSIAARIRSIILDHAEQLRVLASKAHAETGLWRIPMEWLPPFDTKVFFDLLEGLPFRDEVENGRDFRGLVSFGGCPEWDLRNTNFSYLPKTEGHGFTDCHLEGSVFDGSEGDFSFHMCPLRKVRFRRIRCRVFSGTDCIECDFENAKMRKAHFLGSANLQGSSFVGTDLSWANMRGCDLRGCVFRGANLANAAIEGSIIDSTTDFRGANLLGVSWQDRYDNNGRLFQRGTDWRQGTHDSSTIHD